ncbi:hypothetical protein [Burkholderia phage FLC9]|nr:hypothetical protein [Burkholderia phage FLC9]
MALIETHYDYGVLDAKITEPMKVGGVIFRKGIKLSTVLMAAKRLYRAWAESDSQDAGMEFMTVTAIKHTEELLPLPDGERQYVPAHLYRQLQKELALVQQHTVDYPAPTFQQRVSQWVQHCFGGRIRQDKSERDYRFFEEATELIQARGNLSEEDAVRMVRYVYAREKGEVYQEIGGVMTCLAALVATERTEEPIAQEIDMMEAGETELTRIWGKVDVIREKQKTKPRAEVKPTKRLYADD